MMDNKKEQNVSTRRPYHKPQLEEVRLVAEEAVLQNCKAIGVFGPYGVGVGSCQNPGGNICVNLGS
jgi:hypothetical protein